MTAPSLSVAAAVTPDTAIDTSLEPTDAGTPEVAVTQKPTCPCGYDRNHFRVSSDGAFRPMNWFLLMFGISSRPYRIDWRCRMCDTTFDSSSDPNLLRRRLF